MIEAWRERFREVHPDREVPAPVLAESIVCHEDPEEAHRLALTHLGNEWRTVINHYELTGDHFKGLKGYETYQAMSDELTEAGTDNAVVEAYVDAQNWGTPEQIVDRFRDRLDLLGDFSPLITLAMGGISLDDAQRTLRLYAEQVIPELRKMTRKKTAAAS